MSRSKLARTAALAIRAVSKSLELRGFEAIAESDMKRFPNSDIRHSLSGETSDGRRFGAMIEMPYTYIGSEGQKELRTVRVQLWEILEDPFFPAGSSAFQFSFGVDRNSGKLILANMTMVTLTASKLASLERLWLA